MIKSRFKRSDVLEGSHKFTTLNGFHIYLQTDHEHTKSCLLVLRIAVIVGNVILFFAHTVDYVN